MSAKKGKLSIFYNNMRSVRDVDYTHQVLALQHEYENALNKFFEREIYLTYVNEDGSIIAYGDEAIGKAYEKATRNAGRGNLSKKVLDEVIKFNSGMEEINQKINKSAEARKHVYLAAVDRWEFYKHNGKKEIKTTEYPNKNYFHRYYWQKSDNTYGESQKISTRGVIAEAYAGAVLNEDKRLLSKELEGDSGPLAVLNTLIEKDNIPASLKGDIVLDVNNKIQFAIKEGNFSTAMIGQYINIAYNITKIINANKTELILAIPKLVKNNKIADNIVNAINQKGVNAIYDIIDANLGSKKVNSNSWKKTINTLKSVL